MRVGESFDLEKSLHRISVRGFSLVSFDQLAAGQTVELVHMSLPHPELHVEMIIVGHHVVVLQHFFNYFSVLGRKLNLVAELVEESYTAGVVPERGVPF